MPEPVQVPVVKVVPLNEKPKVPKIDIGQVLESAKKDRVQTQRVEKVGQMRKASPSARSIKDEGRPMSRYRPNKPIDRSKMDYFSKLREKSMKSTRSQRVVPAAQGSNG